MKLIDIRIGSPLLKIETRIFHATPRKPTAFERVILSMTDRLGNNITFNSIPLANLFIDVLCVVDPGPLITPTLSELISLDVIRCMGDIESPETLMLRDIEMTERGKSMFAEDMLPAKSMQNDETFYYDPIQQRLLSESQSKAYRPTAPKLSIDATVFEDIFPEEHIRSRIHGPGYRWKSAATIIERLESQSVTVLWKDTPSSIELRSGKLSIDSVDDNLSSYISLLDSEESYNRFIGAVFDTDDFELEDEIPIIDIESMSSTTFEILPVSQALSEWPEDAKFIMPGFKHDDNAVTMQAPPHQAIILYAKNEDSDEIFFKWNEERNGCKIKVNGNYPLPASLRVTNQEDLRCYRVQAKDGKASRQLLVACRVKISPKDDFLRKHLDNLSALVYKKAREDDLKAAVLWEGESQYRTNFLNRLMALNLPLDEVVSSFYSALADVEHIYGSLNRNAWAESLWSILDQSISGYDTNEIEACRKLFQLIAKHGPHAEKFISKLLQSIVQRTQPPKTLNALNEIRSLFHILNPKWSSDFPSRLYTAQLIRSILESFPDDLDTNLIIDENDFFRPLASLSKLYANISVSVGDRRIEELNDDDYVSLVNSKSVSKLADLSHAWTTEMNALLEVLEDNAVLEGTQLALIDTKIAEIARRTAKLIGTLDSVIQSVYVFDTSALIAQPQIVSSIRPNEMFVVTKRVIDELDDKKLDESLRPSVSEAVRNLRRIRKDQIQFCDGDMSLLPSDYRLKGDNLILSVAVRYRKFKPVLITNDNNLSLKAQAEGIASMTSDEFAKHVSEKKGAKRPDLNQQKKNHNYNKSSKRRSK